MRDSWGYDLEAERQQDEFEAFCAESGFDPSEQGSGPFETAFDAWKQEQADRAEDADIERAMERRAWRD